MEITACAVIFPPFSTSTDMVSIFASRDYKRIKCCAKRILFFTRILEIIVVILYASRLFFFWIILLMDKSNDDYMWFLMWYAKDDIYGNKMRVV